MRRSQLINKEMVETFSSDARRHPLSPIVQDDSRDRLNSCPTVSDLCRGPKIRVNRYKAQHHQRSRMKR